VEPCAIETGLLRKTACGHTSVAKCDNCEIPLCSKHAIAQLSPTGSKTGKFLCGDCNAAQRQYEKTQTARAAQAAMKPPPEKPRTAPGGSAPAKPAAPAAAAPAKPEAPPPEEHSDGSIDFTPGKK
jgi:hypothetical protein